MMMLHDKTQADRNGWEQPNQDIPLYIRKSVEGYEGVKICKPEHDDFCIAHGVIRFSGNACNACQRSIAELTFADWEYLKTCLLPERYTCFEDAEGMVDELMKKCLTQQ